MSWWDEGIDWASQVGSDIGGSVYNAFVNPFTQGIEQYKTEEQPWYSNLTIPTPAGPISPFSPMSKIGTGVINELFGLAQKPVNIAAGYYSDLPEALNPQVQPPSISTLGGGSLRDLALEEAGITNPYALKAIEKIGGEALEELSDPTNIPGALVGAGGLAGRVAQGIEKGLAGMGAISGFAGGLPELYKGGENIFQQGINPENFGQILEGLMGVGFGGLSASGFAGGPTVETPTPITPPNTSLEFGPKAEAPTKIQAPQVEAPRVETPTPVEVQPEMVDVYSGGDGTFWSTDSSRAASYGDVKKVTIPLEVFEAGRSEAARLGQPTRFDTVLPNEWVNRAVDAPEIQADVYEAEDTGQSIEDILRELGGESPIVEVPFDVMSVEPPKPTVVQAPEIAPESKVLPFKNADTTLNQALETKGLDSVLETLGLEDLALPERTKTGPEFTPKEELATFVSDLKQEYGNKSWRQKMTPEQKTSFDELQLAAVKAPSPKLTLVPKTENVIPKAEIPPKFQTPPIESQPTQITTPPPPTIPPTEIPKEEGPKTPKKEGGKLKTLSVLERMFLPTLRNLAKTNPRIGKRVKAYDDFHTKVASENIADVREATQGVNKAGEQKIIRFLDGEKVTLDSHEQQVADKLRATLDNIADIAESNKVLVGYRQGYFPRKYENQWEWEVSPRSFGTKNKPLGHLEKSRQGNKLDFRRDFKVLEEYISEATRRVAEVKYLGKDLSKVTGKKFRGEKPTAEYVEKAISRVTGRERSSTPGRFADRLRKVTALGDLAFAAVYQPAQAAHTASTVGFRRATRAAWQTLKNFKPEVLEATRTGALWPNISHEVSKALGDKGYMHGVPTMDKVMRVHANVAGRLLAQDALKGNSYAKRQIESLGLKLDDPKLLSEAGRLIADKTQFRTGSLDLPLWASSPLGKMATQYSSFAYAHAKFVSDMFKHPVKNFGQIARFAAIGLLAGEGVADLREVLKSVIPGKDEEDEVLKRMLEAASGDEDFDDKEWLQKLQAATRSKRIPISSPGWRAVQNLSMVGGLGIFQNVLEKAASGKFWQVPIGPAGSLLVDTAENLRGDITKGVEKGDWRFRGSLKNLVSNLPAPFVSGRKIAENLFPVERKGKQPIVKFPKVNLPKVNLPGS